MLKLKTPINISEEKSTNLNVRSFQFSLSIISFVNSLPNERTFWIISDQLLRSATSVGSNIIEARSSSSRKEFIRYYHIALRSANETCYWLSLIKHSFPKLAVESFLIEAEELSKMLASSIITLKNRESKF